MVVYFLIYTTKKISGQDIWSRSVNIEKIRKYIHYMLNYFKSQFNFLVSMKL